MKAAQFTSFRAPLEVVDLPDPECAADGVVIEIHACGVCRSDHHGWMGENPNVKLPHVPGHEFAGVVIEVGAEVRDFAVGDRVTAPFILSCGKCAECGGGEPTACDAAQVIGFTMIGAYAERLAVPKADFNLVRLPDSLDFVSAAGMGCRVTTAYRALADRAALKAGETLAIHGCGGVGLAAIKIAAALDVEVIAVDPSPEARALADKFGAKAVLSPEGCADAIREMTNGGVHVSMDAVGITPTFDASLRSLRRLGRHVQVGMPTGAHKTPTLALYELVYTRQLSIHGSRGMAAQSFPPLMGMVESGKMKIDDLVTATIPLSQAGTALDALVTAPPGGVTVIDDFTA